MSINNSRNKVTLSAVSSLTLYLIFLIYLLFNLIDARSGFSYDYKYYLYYIVQIADFSFYKIFSLAKEGIYIYLDLSAGIEVGFVVLVKIFSLIFSDPDVVYAALALSSLSVKYYVLKNKSVPNVYSFSLVFLSFILLEGNALRAGISLSFFLLGVIKFENNKILAILFFILSCSIHVQAIPFLLLFLTLYLIYFMIDGSQFRKYLVLVVLSLSGIVLDRLAVLLISDKLSFYATNQSASSGFNLISFFSILFISIYIYCSVRYLSIYRFLLLAMSVVALSIYVFLTSVSVVGDRLWQWGIFFLFLSAFDRSRSKSNFIVKKYSPFALALIWVLTINVTFRYPLTNIMQPFIGYVDLSQEN